MQQEMVQREVTVITDENMCCGWAVSLQRYSGEMKEPPLVPAL